MRACGGRVRVGVARGVAGGLLAACLHEVHDYQSGLVKRLLHAVLDDVLGHLGVLDRHREVAVVVTRVGAELFDLGVEKLDDSNVVDVLREDFDDDVIGLVPGLAG